MCRVKDIGQIFVLGTSTCKWIGGGHKQSVARNFEEEAYIQERGMDERTTRDIMGLEDHS